MNKKGNGMARRVWFVGCNSRLGRKILSEARYAKYREWLGKEVEVDLQTAELKPGSATDTRVQITLPWGEEAVVNTAAIAGLTAADLEEIYRIALDKRYPQPQTDTARVATA